MLFCLKEQATLDIINYCINAATNVVKSRNVPKSFIKEEGANMLFLLLNLVRFSKIDVASIASELWLKVKAEITTKEDVLPGIGATIFKANEYHKFLSNPEVTKYKKLFTKAGTYWREEWLRMEFLKMQPFDDKFKSNEWSVYINAVTFISLTVPKLYQEQVEPWAIRVVGSWKFAEQSVKHGVVDVGFIYFVTHLILSSSDWGYRTLSWSRANLAMISKVVNYLLQDVMKSKLNRNIEPYVELSMCKIILREDTKEQTSCIMSFWSKPVVKQKSKKAAPYSKWRRFAGQHWYIAEYHVNFLVAQYFLLDLNVKISLQVRIIIIIIIIILIFIRNLRIPKNMDQRREPDLSSNHCD